MASKPAHEPLTTEDLDLAIPADHLTAADDGRALEALLSEGLEPEVRGADHPSYIYRDPDDKGAYVQFIAPLVGSGRKRDDSLDRLHRASGIHAEKLRHVDLLLTAPWIARVPDAAGALDVHVVDPSAYLIQKMIVLPERGTRQSKDLLYVFDTFEVFADSLDKLRPRAQSIVREMSKMRRSKFHKSINRYCGAMTDVARAAAGIAASQRQSPPTQRQLIDACLQAWSMLLD